MRPAASYYRDARVLIVGGTGFIGSNLTRTLVGAGADVSILARGLTRPGIARDPKVRFHRADLAEPFPANLDAAGFDFIFDAAGRSGAVESQNNPLEDLRTNVMGQFHLLEAVRRGSRRPRIVLASTRLVYGRPVYLPVDEAHSTEPTSIYGINRLSAEKYHLLYHRVHDVPTSILRITIPYGPFQARGTTSHGVVNLFMRAVIEGRPIMLYGDGTQRRDVIFVDDLVDAFLLVGQCPDAAGQVFNVGGPEPVRLIDIANQIVALAGRGETRLVPWPADAASVETGDFFADTSRLSAVTGWRQTTSLRDGLRASLSFYDAEQAAGIPSL